MVACAGEYRGGYGTYFKVQINGEKNAVGQIGDGMEFEGAEPPEGFFGGLEGTLNTATLYYPDASTENVGSKGMIFNVAQGTWMTQYNGGGGGYGNPLHRSFQKVYNEVMDELLSIDKAEALYGVVINKDTMELDTQKTNEVRAQRLQLQTN